MPESYRLESLCSHKLRSALSYIYTHRNQYGIQLGSIMHFSIGTKNSSSNTRTRAAGQRIDEELRSAPADEQTRGYTRPNSQPPKSTANTEIRVWKSDFFTQFVAQISRYNFGGVFYCSRGFIAKLLLNKCGAR